ncbi:MAG: 16S rRNA (guanine(966)-N(2))-methyltransferase RsmD [Bacteroidetes bacterium]|nr:16S rRNA (guanine(966)-N(2))-methyltransferase RsmD [Bacteroidota bacterium]
MRIISGRFRGRQIQCPSGDHVRPTSDRVKENLFNLLQNHLSFQNAVIADLFCGSGAFGIESLSRGASFVHFVDIHPASLKTITENLNRFSVPSESYRAIKADAINWAESYRGAKVDLILADPPYQWPNFVTLFDSLRQNPSFSEAIFAFEASSDFKAPDGYEPLDDRKYGKTRICLFNLSGRITHE